MNSGIYKIQSIIKPERYYIGCATDIKSRWRHHLRQLRSQKHHSKKLQRHYNKYGESDLQFSIMLGCEKEELLLNEQFFFDSHKAYFNNSPTAGSPKGCKHSEEACRKKSLIRGERHSLFGKHPSKETIEKLINSHKGKSPSDETRLKMSEAHKRRHKTHPISEETKRKIGDANRGRLMPEEQKQKLREYFTGRPKNRYSGHTKCKSTGYGNDE